MPAAYIDDGYTLTKTFDETQFYPRTVIQFRPMLSREQRKFNHRIEQAERGPGGVVTEAGIDKAEKLAAEILTKQIVEWSITKSDGEPLPVNQVEFGKIEPHLAGAIAAVILGNLPPDGETATEGAEDKAAGN